MTTSVAIGLAIAWIAAAATSLGWLMKSRGARTSAPMRHDRPWRSMRALLASRWFAAGVLVASAGGVLHIAALALAPISTVQAVMAAGIVVLGVMAERLFGWPVPGRQRAGVALTALGLLALALSVPELRGAHSSFRAPTMIAFDLALLAASGLLLLAPRLQRLHGHDGALIGAASGALFGLSDIAVKALFGVAGHGLAAVLLSPWLALALLGGLIAQYVSARSLQTGDAVSVTALTGVAVNVANIAGGIVIFGDPLAHGLAGTLIEAGAFAAICIGAFLTPVRAATQPDLGRRAPKIPAQPPETGAAAVGPPPARHLPLNVRASAGGARNPQRRPSWSLHHSRPGHHEMTAGELQQRADMPGPKEERSDRPPLAGALASAAATLLIASKLCDLLEPELGFDTFNLILAFTFASILVGYGLVLGYALLHTRALRSRVPSPSTTTAVLLALGSGALLVIGVEHLNQPPRPRQLARDRRRPADARRRPRQPSSPSPALPAHESSTPERVNALPPLHRRRVARRASVLTSAALFSGSDDRGAVVALTNARAGVIGFAGNEIAAQICLRAGRKLNIPALMADGNHARTDRFVSLAVVASAIVVTLGLNVDDPTIGLTITFVILRITWQSFHTVRDDPGEGPDDEHDAQHPEQPVAVAADHVEH